MGCSESGLKGGFLLCNYGARKVAKVHVLIIASNLFLDIEGWFYLDSCNRPLTTAHSG